MSASGDNEIIMAPCGKCANLTFHDVLRAETVEFHDEISPYKETCKVLQCRGCKSISLEKTVNRADQTLEQVPLYFPPRVVRRFPRWISQLDLDLQALLSEVYGAVNNNQRRLIAMGVRAVIDQVMRHEVGDRGSFENKLHALEDRGIIGKSQRETLATVIDAGSAASHRGFSPSPALIQSLLDVMEMVLNQLYIAGPMLDTLKKQIPPKPSR